MGAGVAQGNADEPVGDEGDVRNDLDVLIAAQDALDGRAGRVEKDEGHGVYEKFADSREGLRIVRKQAADWVQEQVRRRNGHRRHGKGRHLAEEGVLAGAGKILSAYFVADDDSRRQADAPGNRIGQRGVADSRLIGRQVQRPKFGHEEADDAEQARFAEYGDKDGDSQLQLVIAVGPADGAGLRPDGIGAKGLLPLEYGGKDEEGDPRGDGQGVARADAAHGSDAQSAEDEEAEQEYRDDHMKYDDGHRNVSHAVGVDDIAHRRHEKHRQNAQGQGEQVLAGNVAHCRFQSHKVEKGRQDEAAQGDGDDGKEDGDIQALGDIHGNAAVLAGSPQLGNNRRHAEKEAADAGEDGHPDVDGDGDAGQIDRAGLAAEDAAEYACAYLRYLRE